MQAIVHPVVGAKNFEGREHARSCNDGLFQSLCRHLETGNPATGQEFGCEFGCVIAARQGDEQRELGGRLPFWSSAVSAAANVQKMTPIFSEQSQRVIH